MKNESIDWDFSYTGNLLPFEEIISWYKYYWVPVISQTYQDESKMGDSWMCLKYYHKIVYLINKMVST